MVLEAIQASQIMCAEGIPRTEEEFHRYYNIKINSTAEALLVDIWPKSGIGHDYGFSIDNKTGKIIENSIAIGEIIPDPEETE